MTLSKSLYVAGTRCHKLLWFRVTEPDAPELVPDVATQLLFDHGHQVGEEARTRFPGGELVQETAWDKATWQAETLRAMASGKPALFEAAFAGGGGFAAADILEADGNGGWRLAEVKGALDAKPEHVADVAYQLYVLRAAGVPVSGASVMHLNRDCDGADLGPLFVRKDVTGEAEVLQAGVGARIQLLEEVTRGPMPEVKPGGQCKEPTVCPFRGRCEIPRPDHHVGDLYSIRSAAVKKLEERGIDTLDKIPPGEKLTDLQWRQVRSVQEWKMVVEPGLAQDLARFEGKKIAFLDFETIAPAIPVWAGCHPLEHVPVQFSVHVVDGATVTHHQHLAVPSVDPRPDLARALVGALQGADVVVAYYASFEKKVLEHLAANVPGHRVALEDAVKRLDDLLPVVRSNVYHPDFHGSFSLKSVAPALVDVSYAGMTVGEGMTAAAILEGMVLGTGPADEATRRNLLDYCGQDTEALVALYRRLEGLARGQGLEIAPRKVEATVEVAAVEPGEHRVVVVSTIAEALGFAKEKGAGAEVLVWHGPLTPERVADAVQRARREAGASKVTLVAAFENTAKGAGLAGELERIVRSVEGTGYQRAAPQRLGESWAKYSGHPEQSVGREPTLRR